MKKSSIIFWIIFIVFGALLFLLFTNVHLEFFSGHEKVIDNFTMQNIDQAKNVSLLKVMQGKAVLSIGGWITAVLIIIGIPFITAFLFKRKYVKKELHKNEYKAE